MFDLSRFWWRILYSYSISSLLSFQYKTFFIDLYAYYILFCSVRMQICNATIFLESFPVNTGTPSALIFYIITRHYTKIRLIYSPTTSLRWTSIWSLKLYYEKNKKEKVWIKQIHKLQVHNDLLLNNIFAIILTYKIAK